MPKWENVRLNISLVQAISVVLLLFAVYGIYFDLREKAKDALELAQANARAITELNAALRTKGVMQ